MAKSSNILSGKTFTDFKKHELLQIISVHLEKSVNLFKQKSIATKTNEGKWHELIYCILAGSQFPVIKLKIIFADLIKNNNDLIELINIKDNKKSLVDITRYLKNSGYRYHNQKTNTIINTASFFNTKYKGSIDYFLLMNTEASKLRKLLIDNVSGIGIKIASHWLRNIGMDICTIDIHLRRFLFNLYISNENTEKGLKNSDFILLEEQFKQLSEFIDIKIGILQYSIWEYTRSHCFQFKCNSCPFIDSCKRGDIFKSNCEQGDLF